MSQSIPFFLNLDSTLKDWIFFSVLSLRLEPQLHPLEKKSELECWVRLSFIHG
jgi:hypothetical protein